MQLNINGTLTRGMWDKLAEANAANLGIFIFGALDRGYTIKWPGAIVASYSKWQIITYHTDAETSNVYFFYGKEQAYVIPLKEFAWQHIVIRTDCLYYKSNLVYSPTYKPFVK